MKRRLNNNKPNAWLRILIFSFLGLLTIFAAFKFGLQNIKLNSIECRSQFGKCGDFIQKKLDSLVGEDYLQVIRYVENFVNEEPSIVEYRLQYVPPRNLRLTILERKAVFAISKVDSEIVMLIDKEGRFLGFTQSTDLPIVFTQRSGMSKGESLSGSELFALNLVSDMYKNFRINKSELNGESLIVELDDGIKVIFPTEGERQVLMGSVILIYNDIKKAEVSKLNTSGQIIDTIDLRFSNPVLH